MSALEEALNRYRIGRCLHMVDVKIPPMTEGQNVPLEIPSFYKLRP